MPTYRPVTTCSAARARVTEVAVAAHDPEKAHALEDELLRDFLRTLVDPDVGVLDAPWRIARALLHLDSIEYDRWHA